MNVKLAHNSYGESRIRLLRVMPRGSVHELKDLTLSIDFEGDFEAAHIAGDNRKILPASTMTNTVYVLARQYPAEAVEEFVLHIVDHFLTYNPQLSRIRVNAGERPWSRILIAEKPHASAFVSNAGERRTTHITATREHTSIQSGIENLLLLKTTTTAFDGFLRDPYTTLQQSSKSVISAEINAAWTYETPEAEVPFSATWHGIRKILLEAFANHSSRSLQHLAYAMGQAVLDNFEAIAEIQLALADNLYSLVDLKPFGMENESEVFSPAEEPHALVQATLRRES
ncbi:MAG TPA: urate oxidase [Candidatus Acidoferrales bacterium]|nr:urate oxidase [Candidatus Acidoferrales bacterium]